MKVVAIPVGSGVSITVTQPLPTSYITTISKADGSEIRQHQTDGSGPLNLSPLTPGTYYVSSIGVNSAGAVLDSAATRFVIQ